MPPALRGTVVTDFLIDRYAMGISYPQISAEYAQLFGGLIPTEEECSLILEKSAEQIKKREDELKDLYLSNTFARQLEEIKQELKEMRDKMLKEGDVKAYVSVVNSYLKSLEITQKSIEMLKAKEDTKLTILQQNKYYIFDYLRDKGLIEIKDPRALAEIFGEKNEGGLVPASDITGKK